MTVLYHSRTLRELPRSHPFLLTALFKFIKSVLVLAGLLYRETRLHQPAVSCTADIAGPQDQAAS
jgi:hypothetical protein